MAFALVSSHDIIGGRRALFIDSVKNFAAEITDPDLKRNVRAFTAQEAVHSREHAAYNALLAKRGFPIGKSQDIISRSIKIMKRVTSHRQQLATTCAYEHFTALFAEGMLGDPRVFAGAHRRVDRICIEMRSIWE